MAQKLFLECGFSEEEAREELYQLAKGNLENIHKQGCIRSLTGPIERNDIDTVKMHLCDLNSQQKAAYKENGKQLVAIAREKNPDRDYGEMDKLFAQNEMERA